MAKTTFAGMYGVNWPSSTDPHAEITTVQITGSCGPGSLVYFESAGVARPYVYDNMTGNIGLAGVLGQKYDQDIDTAYTDKTYGVPMINAVPGIEVPIKITDQGAALQIGAPLTASTTAGSATLMTTMHGSSGLAVLKVSKAPVADDDTRCYARFI